MLVEIRRLVELGTWSEESSERAIKLAIITGFPDRISMVLQQTKDAEFIGVNGLLDRIRILSVRREGSSYFGCCRRISRSCGWMGLRTIRIPCP